MLRAWQRTLECATVVRATAVLLQCPKSFRPTTGNVDRIRALLTTVPRPSARLLWEPRGDWPDTVVSELCAHPTGMRHVHTDEELRALPERLRGRPQPYVLFNNLPRVRDAERFLEILGRDEATGS